MKPEHHTPEDNDSNGKLTDWNFSKFYKSKDKSKTIYDLSKMWTNCLIDRAKKGISQEAQDVFFVADKNKLAFTPDGCKENKKMKRPIQFRCSIYEKKLLQKNRANEWNNPFGILSWRITSF